MCARVEPVRPEYAHTGAPRMKSKRLSETAEPTKNPSSRLFLNGACGIRALFFV